MSFHDYKAYDIEALDSGLHVFLEPIDLTIVSAGWLLDRFNNEFDPNEPLTAKPLGMGLNPEVRGCRVYRYHDVWVIAYRRNFRVIIFKHSRMATGPHAAKLYYQSEQTKLLYWIATLQICNCMFYSEDQIQINIFTHIMNRDFYMSEKSMKDKIPK